MQTKNIILNFLKSYRGATVTHTSPQLGTSARFKLKKMKNYLVTIVLIIGYHWNEQAGEYDTEQPKLKQVEFRVIAANETAAISQAKELETSSHSIWESYASEE